MNNTNYIQKETEREGAEAQSALRDILTDLRHEADSLGLDFHEACDGSYEVYHLEKQEEGNNSMNWRVNFYDKNSDETRSLIVQADSEDAAEIMGEKEADCRGWSNSFRVADAEPID